MRQRNGKDWSFMRRSCALLLTGAWLLALAGCSTIPKESDRKPDSSVPPAVSSSGEPQKLTISYSNADPINPYRAASRVNLDLTPLLYEGLTVLDAELTPQLALAASLDNTNPLAPVAVLRSDAVFSDGSPVTAADVAGSFALAKQAAVFQPLLENVQAARATDEKTIVFTLRQADVQFAACLSFPVLRASDAAQKSADVPLGSGQYVFTADGTAAKLTPNPYQPAPAANTTIYLQHLSTGDAMLSGLENGSLSYFFSDLSGGEIPRTSNASLNAPMNYLVFLGINHRRSALSEPLVRQGLSAAIGRSTLCKEAFAGYARPATTPFHPNWSRFSELSGFSDTENMESAVAQLEQAGYNTKSGSSQNTKTLSLELLINQDNSFRTAAAEVLRRQLEQVGVTLTVTALPFADVQNRLNKGQFDLYLGEIRLSADLSLRPFFSGSGAAGAGGLSSTASADAYTDFLSGAKTPAQFTELFVSDVPFIPLCWRDGMAAYNRSMNGVTPSVFNVYAGIGGWVLTR